MATNARTERGTFRFRTAEASGGAAPWIMTDPLHPEDRLKVLGTGGFVGFDLKPGTTLREAEEVAKYLNDHIASISCTLLD